MKKITQISKFLLVASALFLFISCKKDEPVHEHDNEEMKTMTLTFVEKASNVSTSVSIDATDQVIKTLSLKKGDYDMSIKLFDFDGDEIQKEIEDDANEHQFFFVGAHAQQIDFTYLDAQVGLRSNWKVLQTATNIPLKIVLMHGLNKSLVKPTDWNSANYLSIAGGSVDISTNLVLNLID